MFKVPARVTVAASWLSLVAWESARAQAPVKVGSEFAVNTFTAADQYDAQVASTASGEFVVAWTTFGRDGDNYGVSARRFDAAGVPQGGEFQVASYTVGIQSKPAVDRDGAGGFVIAWTSYGQDGAGGSGVFARRFDALGAPQAAEFRVNSYTPGTQRLPAVGLDAEGDFVIVWQSGNQDGAGGSGVFGRRFNAAGAAQGVEFQVNSFTPGDQGQPAVDLEANGDFVAVWHSLQDTSILGVFGQRFSSSGAPQGPEFQANTYETGTQAAAVVGVDADGDFVVAWHSSSQDGSGYGAFARRFKASGAPQGGDLLVNTFTTGDQRLPAVAADAEGDFVVAWSSNFQDGDLGGIFAQRFDAPILIDVDGDGFYLPLTDGLLLLRFGFGFTGATLINGVVGPGCTRCNTDVILAYMKSLV